MPSDRVGDGRSRGHGGSRNSARGRARLQRWYGEGGEGAAAWEASWRRREPIQREEVRKRVLHGELELLLMAGVGVSGGVENGTTGSL